MLAPKKAVLAPLIALSALLCSTPAIASAAPDNSGGYLATLDQHNIAYSDPTRMVHIATTLCQELRNNMVPPDEAVRRIQNLGFTSSQAGVIAADAVLSFCPDMNADR